MNVRLISVTNDINGEMSPEQLIVYCARVSNPENQNNHQTADRLIKYLIKHKHWSPFEMVDMTVEIKTSRAIAQQILRHRFAFQEWSQRYSNTSSYEKMSIRKAGATNRQSSLEEFDPIIDFGKASDIVNNHMEASFKLYASLLEAGVAKECARGVLPLNTSTTLFMKGSVRSWIHYLQVRLSEDTQLEHREVAKGVEGVFKQVFPNIHGSVFC